MATHLDLMERMRKSAWFEVKKDAQTQGSDGLVAAIVLGGIVVAVLALVAFKGGRATLALRRRTRFKRTAQLRDGDGPETAIVVGDEQGVCDSLARVRCSCGARPFERDKPFHQEGFVFDGRRLLAVRLDCWRCSNVKDVYFRLANAE